MLLDKKIITGILCSLIFYTSLFSANKPHLYILIHGSMASPKHMTMYGNKKHWCQPGHKSFELLAQTSNATLINHPWSGGIQLSDLVAGAKELIVLIKKHGPTHTIHIIAHSNGGNVALLALDTLVRKTNKPLIAELILLGTPIYFAWYPASIKAAHRIYNLFSYGDLIQPVFGTYERLLPEQSHIFNIQVTINAVPATHNQLYKADIIQFIPQFSRLFTHKDIYWLQFTTGQDPIVVRDSNRDADILADRKTIQQLDTGTKDSWYTRLKNRGAHYRKTANTLIEDIQSAIADIN